MPLDYSGLLNVQRPIDRAFTGYQQGAAIQDREEARVAAQLAQKQKQQALQAQQEEARLVQSDLAAMASDPNAGHDEYTKFIAKHPQVKDHYKGFYDAMEAGNQEAAVNDAKEMVLMLDAGQEDIVKESLTTRITAAKNTGDTENQKGAEAMLAILTNNPDASKTSAIGMLASVMPPDQFKNFMGVRKGAKGKDAADKRFFAPIVIQNKAGDKKMLLPGGDPDTGKGFAAEITLPEGYEISSATAEEMAQLKIETAAEIEEQKITGKGKAKRRQTLIDGGIAGSKTIPNLRRARTLLQSVKTGGFNAASIRAKQLFGFESADEGELSNRLGKAVLTQLRETFGAAFTVGEGDKLDRIEANFKKSPQANMRLIEQLIKIGEKKAREGINAAVKAEDFEAAKSIKDNLTFSLDTDTEGDLTAEEQAELDELRKMVK